MKHMIGHTLFLNLRLYPHRSLTVRQFKRLMAVVAVITALSALRFLVLGAWPVAFFFLLDAALLYAAFRLNYASAKEYEEVQLDEDALLVRRVTARGKEEQIRFEPYWVRLELETFGEDENKLWLRSHGQRLLLGRFLTPEERREIKAVIEDGLARRDQALRYA
ncbi:DUF2244 domain-containing protein [Pedomonas sp. V897]|uniref:DUF2244 domain-containing protein n=1 Tax=Pedomonas sp. V897 TaxID=3446482 RepID=UPI003EE19EB0